MKKRRWMYMLFGVFLMASMASLSWAQDYSIGPEDVIEVVVWKEPDVSRIVLVRPDGKISLPLIGDVQAQGMNPQALAENLRKAFATYGSISSPWRIGIWGPA